MKTRTLVTIAGTPIKMNADFGHAIAHIFSARYANAPMDRIVISAGSAIALAAALGKIH